MEQSNNRGKQNTSINMGKYSVTKEQIQQLQIEAKSILTDKLLKKVIETEAVSVILFVLSILIKLRYATICF